MSIIRNDKPIRIWVISRLYLPNFSGAVIQAHQIFSQLVQQGFSVTVLTTSDRAASHLKGQRIEQDGVEIRYLATPHQEEWLAVSDASKLVKFATYLKGLLSNLSMGVLTAWMLWREGKANDIVRIYSLNHFSFIPVMTARLHGMYTVVHMTLLGSDDPAAIKKRQDKFFEALTLPIFRHANTITGYSTAQVKSCLSTGISPNKVFIIPGGVDLNKFYPVSGEDRIKLRQKLGLKPDNRFIIFVGAAIARKGLDVVVEAFIQLNAQINDVELLVVGPCDFNDPIYKLGWGLRDKLKAAGCSSHVHWIGEVNNVYQYMQVSNTFCLPTRREGFGIVIIEAMACGLPVVVTRLEGVTTDIICSDQHGVLIDKHDPEAYAQALLRILQNPVLAKKMGDAAKTRAEVEFNLEYIVERYARLYRELYV